MTYFEDENFHATQKSGKKTIIRGGLKFITGIAVVYGFVNELGGRIEVFSNESTCFEIFSR